MRDAEQMYDVVVVGGGSAGLSGALALGRSRRRVLVVDSREPRNARAAGVHNYLTSEGMPPAALVAAGRAEVARYGVEVREGRVLGARSLAERSTVAAGADVAPRFAVELENGSTLVARRLLVTTGLIDELPDVAGVAERWGRDVLHCPYCHGWEVRDRAIGVLATGPMATHSAMLFRQLSDDVMLLSHTSGQPSAEQAEQLAARGIPVLDGEVAELEVEDDLVVGVRLKSGRRVPLEVLVVAPRFTARSELLAGLGLVATDFSMGDHVLGSVVAADATGATSVPGVWVAGNVTDPMAQVVVAAAAGLKAGAMINADLVAEDTAVAVAAARAATTWGRGPTAAVVSGAA